MKRKKAPVMVDAPRFRSVAEEAEWWDSHQDLIADHLVTDIDNKARQLAEAKGIGYQTPIKVLLHDALKREERKAS